MNEILPFHLFIAISKIYNEFPQEKKVFDPFFSTKRVTQTLPYHFKAYDCPIFTGNPIKPLLWHVGQVLSLIIVWSHCVTEPCE
jgi:hypothetical protein